MKNLKTMGLSLLALVAFMAVSASAAQAEWVILRNGANVSEVTLKGTVEAGRLLVDPGGLGLTITCTGGAGSGKAKDGATLTGTATIVFSGCDVLGFEETCDVRGAGDAKGSNKITATGKATGEMKTKTSYLIKAEATATPFADVRIENEECPFFEINGEVTGSIGIEILEAEVNKQKHTVEVVEQNLKYGTSSAFIENSAGGNLKGEVEDSASEVLKIELLNL